MIKSLKTLLLFLVIITGFTFSQPRLSITPNEIEFENNFNRLSNVYFINTGTENLIIDSIAYNYNYYFIRFDKDLSYPLTLSPGDTAEMDCILAGYYTVSSADTLDTMYVYSNSVDGMEDIKIKIDYYDDDRKEGIINGQVTDGNTAIPDAKISFFYAGSYIAQTVKADQNGFYSTTLPPGSYKVSAEKDSYYVTFFGQQSDLLNADFIVLQNDSIKTADIIVKPLKGTPINVYGRVFDFESSTSLRRAVVIVRPGRHSPAKIVSNSVTNDSVTGTYTAFINEDGTYSINDIASPGYYYIQAFSDYFVPSYYSSSGSSPTFWQQTDSVYLSSDFSNADIYMPRDSSIGGGKVTGIVSINSGDTISDVIIYAQSVNSQSSIFNYAFPNQEGTFKIPFLPYGSYRLVTQKIGYEDGYSSVFTIDSLNKEVSNINLTLTPTSVEENPIVPESHVLLYNYPNPFNPSTTIEFYLPVSSYIELKIFDVLGKEITTLQKDYLFAGVHRVEFNPDNLVSGVYFVTLSTKEGLNVKKILLLK